MLNSAELVSGECFIHWEPLQSWNRIDINSVYQDWPLNTHLYLRWAVRNISDKRSFFWARLRGVIEGNPDAIGLTGLIPLDPGEFGVGDMEIILGGPKHNLTLELMEWDQLAKTYEYKVGDESVLDASPFNSLITMMMVMMMMGMMMKAMND